MNKCQHGEKITTFCASQCCAYKQAAGCDSCMKKYHNHMGTTIYLTEEDIISLVKKYTMDSTIKPKCRVLQETIYAYFNLVKNQLTNSLDAVCKNIINQIGYPYLYTNNTLSTYKRLKNKEYKKLIQKDFRVLYQLSQKISEKQLAKEQNKIYVTQMKATEEMMNSIETLMRQYQNIIKKYNPGFGHQRDHITKINQIFRQMQQQVQENSPKSSQIKNSQNSRTMNSPVYQFKEKEKEIERKDSFMKVEEVKQEKKTGQRVSAIANSPAIAKSNFGRDVSLDKKLVKQHKFATTNPKDKDKPVIKPIAITEGSPQITISKSKEDRMESVRQELNTKELQINQKKKMLIQMMRQKEDNGRKEKAEQNVSQRRDTSLSPSRPRPLNIKPLLPSSSLKQPQQIIFTDPSQLLQIPSEPRHRTLSQQSSTGQFQQTSKEDTNQHYAFTQLPAVEEKSPVKNREESELFREKVIVIPTNTFSSKRSKNSSKQKEEEGEIQSPLLKIKNIMDKFKNNSSLIAESSGANSPGLKAKPVPPINSERQMVSNTQKSNTTVSKDRIPSEKQANPFVRSTSLNENILDLIPIYHKKTETTMQLKENQQKSLALLLKSLSLKAQEAIPYLQKAFSIADNNLSAVQYLSFLYLQLDRPSQCLRLCNKMLQKIQHQTSEPQELSLILNNNKTAALNMLGRYSESIVILERCLRYRQKDYFYKNLGDAYFSISIYEKAIYNYEKVLKINGHHDEAHYNLAVCLYIQENYFNAKLAILKAIQINGVEENYRELCRNIQQRIASNNY